MTKLSNVVAKTVVFDEHSKVLLIRRSATDARRPLEWDMPGGFVEEGESYITATAREIHEEAGLVIPEKAINIVWASAAFTDYGNVVWVFFVARTKHGAIKLSNEHDKAIWVSLDDAIKQVTYPLQQKVLKYIKSHHLLPR
jgi:ADP-ribose pyrophosphatase YjhB (NUDIX family)